jgi:hypothetical protein
MLNQWFRVGGAVMAFVGLVTLPEDINTWWARLQDVGGMFEGNPLAGGALAFGIILVALGYRDELRRRLSGSKRWRSDKEFEDELTAWLRDSGFSVQQQPTMPGVSFTLTATSVERPVTIVRLAKSPGIILQTVVKPSPPHDTVIGAMDDDQSSSLKEDLGIELARFGLGFSLEDILGQGILLVHPLVVSDTLTQYQFIERVNFVARAILLVQVIVTKHVREAEQRQGTAPAQLTPVPQSSSDRADFPIVSTS